MQALLRNRKFLFIVFGLFLLNLFIANHSTMLWDEDEAAYAGFAKNIVENGDWLVPDFMWSDIHRKPPLHFWMVAVSYKIFGIHEFATRLPGVLSIIGTVLLVFFLGRRVFGRDVALSACIVMACSLFIPNIAKIAVTDAPLLFCQTLSALSLFIFIKNPKWTWNLLFWLGIALGVLIKGPPILILCGGLWFFLFIVHPERKRLIGTHPWIFLPLALLPLLGWGYLAYQHDPEMMSWMIDWYITKRVSGSVLGQTAPPGYYLLVIILAFLPLLPFLPAAFVDGFKRLRKREEEMLMLAGWLLSGWLFYELLPSKLPTYVLGAIPAVAILIARSLPADNHVEYPYYKLTATFSVLYVFLIFTLVIILIFAIFQVLGRVASLSAIKFSMFIWPLAFVMSTLIFAKRYKYGIGGLVINGLLFTTLAWFFLMPLIEQPRSAPKRLAETLNREAPAGTTVLLGDDFTRIPSVPFYLSQYVGKQYFHYYDRERMVEILGEPFPYAAVVGEAWKEKIEADLMARGDSLFINKKIEGWTTDAMDEGSYWLLMRYRF